MRPLLFALCVVFAIAFGGASAQQPAWQPSPGHTQIPDWPGAAPDSRPVAGPEASHWRPTGPGGPGGFTVYQVTRPTMTVYSPDGKNTGAAMVVFPGGGYLDLAIGLEGTESVTGSPLDREGLEGAQSLRHQLGQTSVRRNRRPLLGEESRLRRSILGVAEVAQTDADEAKPLTWVQANTVPER